MIDTDNPRDAGNIYIAATAEGWIWHIPLADDLRSVGVITDPKMMKGLRRADRDALYLDLVRGCPEMAAILEGSQWEGPHVHTLSDWSYLCRRFHGEG